MESAVLGGHLSQCCAGSVEGRVAILPPADLKRAARPAKATNPTLKRRCPRGLTASPGTSRWNKIEHRLFSFITQNWRGKPLVSFEVILSLIAATTTNERTQSSFRIGYQHALKN